MATKRTVRSLPEHSREAVLSREVARAATIAPPFIAWALVLVAGVVLHLVWPHGGWLAPTVILAITAALAYEARHLARQRTTALAKHLAAATQVLIGLWLAWVVDAGITIPISESWPFRAWLLGCAVAVFWACWLHIHEDDDSAGGGIRKIIGEASEHTAVPNLKATIRPDTAPGRLRLNLVGDHGTSGDDIIKAGPQINAAVSKRVRGGIPPGSIKLIQHPDQAHAAIATVTDPRILDTPRLWPGPSLAGSSIADPITVGFWADGIPLAFRVINHHLLLMGCTGAGKSFGYGASEIGETVTRPDAAVIGIDFAKGGQVLGPWRPALHHLATELGDGRNVLWGACQSITPRLEHLGGQGLAEWELGCGLTHLTIWIEEASKFFKELPAADVEGWLIPGILAMRAAGIRIVFSIQRADFSNMPTTVRSQLASACMGLLDSKDAAFGLSEYQSDHGCQPALWGSEWPGKIYMDCPGVSHEHKIMEGRTWSWGGRQAPQTAAAYATGFPASERPFDAITQGCIFPAPTTHRQPAPPRPAAQQPPQQPQQETTVHPNQPPPGQNQPSQAPPTEAFEEPLPPDEYDRGGVYDEQEGEDQPIQHPAGEGFEFAAPPPQNVRRLKMTAEQAHNHLAQCIAAWYDHRIYEIDMGLMVDVLEINGLSRTWPYEALSRFVSSGHLEQLDNPRRWRINHRPDVDVPASADIPYPDADEDTA